MTLLGEEQMIHVVRKAYYDFEKEEKFLNQMSEKGWALVDYSWCKYVFKDAPKGEYIYRLELLEHPVYHPESQEYIKFMEDTGAEFVASYNRWVYFRRKETDGEFNIYSDMDSKIRHYNRIRQLFIFVFVFNFFIGVLNLSWGYRATTIGHTSVNFYVSIISLSISVLFLIFLIMPLNKKIDTLKSEKEIHE